MYYICGCVFVCGRECQCGCWTKSDGARDWQYPEFRIKALCLHILSVGHVRTHTHMQRPMCTCTNILIPTHTRMCTLTQAHTYPHICACESANGRACAHTNARTSTHILTHSLTQTHTHSCTRTHVLLTNTHAYTRAHIHTPVNRHTHTHTHTHTHFVGVYTQVKKL